MKSSRPIYEAPSNPPVVLVRHGGDPRYRVPWSAMPSDPETVCGRGRRANWTKVQWPKVQWTAARPSGCKADAAFQLFEPRVRPQRIERGDGADQLELRVMRRLGPLQGGKGLLRLAEGGVGDGQLGGGGRTLAPLQLREDGEGLLSLSGPGVGGGQVA